MDGAEYVRWSAVAIGAAVRAGELSAISVVEAALRRIADVDGRVRAFQEVWAEQALARARVIDRGGVERTAGRRGGPAGVGRTGAERGGDGTAGAGFGGTGQTADGPTLLGVPLAVKGRQAERLVAAGAVPVGRTAVPGKGTGWQTWGWTERGVTVNPWNPELVPGGSSAGSAVAVATGMVPLATGSDGAGSVRIPAAWCGVLGLKATNGTVPPVDASGLGVGGVLARKAEDLWAWLGVERTPSSTPLRVAWSGDLGFAETEAEIERVARAALTKMVAKGKLVEKPVEVALVDPEPAWRSLRGAGGAQEATAENDRRLREVFEHVDLIAAPTTPNPPHGHEGPGDVMSVALTWAFNVSGHPAISVPAGFTADGLPVGLQFVARHHREVDLLIAAEQGSGVEAVEPGAQAARRLRGE
ncbi:amidase [Kribbella sp. NPDC051770]|uniref:amidase n=1 Tax=Kribbella sp. NPDC051770 TaxID=3155413 RepID=UPI003428F563